MENAFFTLFDATPPHGTRLRFGHETEAGFAWFASANPILPPYTCYE